MADEQIGNSLRHLLYIPFSGLGLHKGYRGDVWLKNRLTIFKRFVLPALQNQTSQQFTLWFSWRPQEEKNPLVKEFRDYLEKIRGISYVFTFRGLCIYDDKYDDKTARDRLYRALSLTLPELEPIVGDAKWVYMTIQPSDDLYECGSILKIQETEPKEHKAVGWKKGYVMDYGTKQIAHYDPDTTPPFTTFIFPKETFLDPQKHFDYIGPYESHEYVPDHFKYEELEGRGFCVGTHGHNISTTWEHPYKGPILEGANREAAWLRFGVWDADPHVAPKRLTLKLRTALNLLPRPIHDLIRKIYHSLC